MALPLRRGLQRRVAELLVDGAQALGALTVAGTLGVTGATTLAALVTANNGVTVGAGQVLLPDGSAASPALAFSAATGTGIARVSGQQHLTIAGVAKAQVTSTSVAVNGELVMGANDISFTERTDPAAPAANGALLYSKDSGGGKTQLAVRFNTGAVQVPAAEP